MSKTPVPNRNSDSFKQGFLYCYSNVSAVLLRYLQRCLSGVRGLLRLWPDCLCSSRSGCAPWCWETGSEVIGIRVRWCIMWWRKLWEGIETIYFSSSSHSAELKLISLFMRGLERVANEDLALLLIQTKWHLGQIKAGCPLHRSHWINYPGESKADLRQLQADVSRTMGNPAVVDTLVPWSMWTYWIVLNTGLYRWA